MIDTTIQVLSALRAERVAGVGVLVALFADDPAECVRRLEIARDAAREYEATLGRSATRQQRRLARDVATWADDMIPPVRQLAALCPTPPS